MKKDIVSMLPEELEQDFALLGEQKFRAKQVFQWLGRGVRDFDKMTNLSKPLREKLKDEYELYEPKVIGKQVSAIVTGRLPSGLRVLRLDDRRTCAKPRTVRDIGRGLVFAA